MATWMEPDEQDEDEQFRAIIAELAQEPLPSMEAEERMPSADLATPMERQGSGDSIIRDLMDRGPARGGDYDNAVIRDLMDRRVPEGVNTLEDLVAYSRQPGGMQRAMDEGLIAPLSNAEPARDPFGLTEEDDPALADFIAQQQQPAQPQFDPRYADPAKHPIALQADPTRGNAEAEERDVYPDAAPSDMAGAFYGRLGRDRALAGDSEGVDFAQERAQAYVANPEPYTPVGSSPMWEKYSNQGAHMGSGGGLAALAGRGGSTSYGGGAGGPPMARDNSGLMMLAAGADFFLNKGRNTGRLLGAAAGQDAEYENYNRNMAHQKALADLAATNRRGMYGGRGMDPLTHELRLAQLAQRDQQLRINADREARLAKAYEDQHDPGSAMSARARELAVQGGISPDIAAGKSAAQLGKLSGAVNEYLKQVGEIGDARTSRAAATSRAQAQSTMVPKIQTAEGIAGATHPYKMAQIAEGARLRNEAERQSPAYEMARQKMAAAESHAFTSATERYLNVADNIAPVREYLDKYEGQDVPGFGTADSVMPDRFLPEEALRARQQLRNAAEQVLRANTGAAAPITEEQANAVRTGMQTGATEQQVRIATEIVENFARNNIRSFATNREDAARSVLRNRGLEQWAYPEAARPDLEQSTRGGSGADETAPFTSYRPDQDPSRDRSRTAGQARQRPKTKAQPAQTQSIGMRNGKPVRRIEWATAPDGKRVRVVFYADGSREVVQ